MRKIKVSFILTSNKVSMDSLAEQIGINPYVICSDFPKNSIAEPCWYVEVVSDSTNIEEPLNSLGSIIKPHKEQIIELCSKYEIEPTVLIVVDSDYEDRPELTIPFGLLELFGQLKAEVSLEIVNNWD